MVLYDQREYNRARRWRLPKCTLAPGEYQGFEGFFKDLGDGWILDDRIVVGVQLRLVSKPERGSETNGENRHTFQQTDVERAAQLP